ERVRAENKLRESEARYRVLIDSAKEYAIVTMDNEGLITSWSSGAERMMGYTAPEIIGQSSAVLFTHEDVMTNAPKDELTRAREEGQAENERWHRRKDGSLFWSSGRVMPLMNEGMNGFVKIFQDRTAQRDAEAARDAALARLQDADRQKDEFLATLGHELRNPLTPIRYAARLLKHGCTPEMVEQARVTIDRQTTQMARLLDDLLDISRITRNVIELRRDTMDLRDAIKLGVEIAWPIVNSVGHELKVHLPPEAVYVVGDPARLAQIVSNLLHNAAKFTEPGGRIVVSLQREADEAVIRVSDNGIGLTRESMERVFGLFTQVGGPHGQSRGGLGIGLAVVKRLVELHGGRVDVASAGLGTGSEFTVRLPLAAVGTSPKHHGLTNEAPLDRPHAQVLVVDDNVDAADSLAAILRSDGYSVKVAYDGVSAMELAEILQPQLVVLDLGLPRADGYAVARWIRQQPWGSGAHIVAVTGWGQKNDRERSSAAGFDAHLVKPVDPNDLERWLEKSAHAVARSNS
ncbi:MAG TPA: ATP-binding protein, partial [Burkholderiaceae bacterium]|nr:ATP-binding protein [Burkholderiaceae bacterium]